MGTVRPNRASGGPIAAPTATKDQQNCLPPIDALFSRAYSWSSGWSAQDGPWLILGGLSRP